MPLIRTPKGLQWLEPSEISVSDVAAPPVAAASAERPKWLSAISSKDILPWILAASHLVSWFGVRYLTSDRRLQQQQDDHIAIADIQKHLSAMEKDSAGIAAKVDLMLQMHNRQ